MCSVFGFIGGDGANSETLRRIALAAESRGRHAFGIAWEQGGKIKTWKSAGPASAHLDELERAAGSRLVIGHCRYATDGDATRNHNNHPHRSGVGAIVHNGRVANYVTMAWHLGLRLKTECDSEVIAAAIAARRGSLLARASVAAGAAVGPMTVLGAWPGRLLIIRRGRPLFTGATVRGRYFSSVRDGLPGRVRAVEDFRLQVVEDPSAVSLSRHDEQDEIVAKSYRGG